jgi:hypothetical protein
MPIKVNKVPIAGDSATKDEMRVSKGQFQRYQILLDKTRPDEFVDAQNHYNPRYLQ